MARTKKVRPYHKYFTFKIRNGIWKVIFKHSPGQQISTGLKTDDHQEEDAVAWAFQYMYQDKPQKNPSDITIKNLTEEFFIPGKCPYLNWCLKRNRTFGSEYHIGHRGRLENYVWPRFGSYQLHTIDAEEVEDWLVQLKSAKSAKDLADNTKNKVLDLLHIIMKYAKYKKLIKENPLSDLKRINEKREKREPFTFEELKMLFPKDREKLFQIWGHVDYTNPDTNKLSHWRTQMWITYFLTEAISGWRPGEVGAITVNDRIKKKINLGDKEVEVDGLVVSNAVDSKVRKVKDSIKTAKKGVQTKAFLLTERLKEEYNNLYYEKQINNDDCELWFHMDGRPVITDSARKRFRFACERAGIDRRGRTPYCLRHALCTDLHVIADNDLVNRMMGHTKYRPEYDHRNGVALLVGLALREGKEKVEAIRAL